MTDHVTTILPFETEANKTSALLDLVGSDDASSATVIEKLQDALTPGYQAEFDPAEADAAGAFMEDALSEADALASSHDTLHFTAPAKPALQHVSPRTGMGVVGMGVGLVLPIDLYTPVKE